MGIERIILHALGWAAIVVSSAVPGRAAGERSGLTPLPDPAAGFVPWGAQDGQMLEVDGADRDDNVGAFSRALAQASVEQRRSIAAQCKSAAPADGELRIRWEINCRYTRR